MPFAPIFPIIHPILKWSFPNCLWMGDTKRREIALTFDDGPHPQHTSELLKVLAKNQIQASFFLLGLYVERYPQTTKDIYESGHWIGLHGYEHKPFLLLNSEGLKSSLEKTQNRIYQACGLAPELIYDVRPPNGIITPHQLDLLTTWGYRSVMWSVVPEDWVRPGILTVKNRVIKQTVNGSIIVLHDGYDGGEDVAQSAELIIPILLDQGYKFVTINQLWQQI